MTGRRRTAGEGSIFKRSDGLWVAQLRIDGKKKQKYSKTQKEVREWLREQREAVAKGSYTNGKDMPLEAFLDQYMTSQTPSLRTKTVDGYLTLIRKHINPALGKVKLSQLRADQVQEFYNNELETYSNRTVQYIHSVLHKALDQAVKFGLVARNVCDLVDPPKVKREPLTIWTSAQAREFLEFVKGTRYYPMICLAYIGLRKGEILGLYPSNFDIINGTITVNHSLQFLPKKGIIIDEPKTSAGIRTIKLPDFVYEALKAHPIDDNQMFMFVTSSGTPFNPRNFSTSFDLLVKKSGLPKVRFHDLRHFAISFMINELHIPPSVVQSIVGHASPLLTLSVYTHTNTEQQHEAMSKMSGFTTA
jgi:integrase